MISYEMGKSLYLNLTNRCTNDCDFCVRQQSDNTLTDYLNGAQLWLEKEPEYDEIIRDIEKRDLLKYDSIVFCGFGEPLMRFDVCISVAKWLKSHGVKHLRVNTNGQANLIYNKNVAPELCRFFSVVSISLNAKNAQEYEALCHSKFGLAAFDGILDFAAECVKAGAEVIMTVIDELPAEDIKICREIAHKHGAELRIRAKIGEQNNDNAKKRAAE
ncbi:MAG: TatD family nuclease-associated radical SAM protein [Clostridiales bacterium]|jgi:TatD family-associated radical SAM protein|nr:TatD family nuclease-associated radical SAM protein [Clostridiales bacterium]